MSLKYIAITLMIWATRAGITPSDARKVAELFQDLVGLGMPMEQAAELVLLSVEA